MGEAVTQAPGTGRRRRGEQQNSRKATRQFYIEWLILTAGRLQSALGKTIGAIDNFDWTYCDLNVGFSILRSLPEKMFCRSGNRDFAMQRMRK
jgi:hypothetical protein